MRLLLSGEISFAIAVKSVTFGPRWSNLLWDLVVLSPVSEAERISLGVRSVVGRLEQLEPDALEATDHTIKATVSR